MTQQTLILVGLMSALVAVPSLAQGQATSRQLARAASCLQRFADGEELPEVRRTRAAEPAQGLLAMLGAPENPQAADTRARLAQCMPRALQVPSRLTRSQGRWLATCFQDVSEQLGAARTPTTRATARQRGVGCREIARAMSTWDPDIATMTSGRRPIAPGVRFDTIREGGHSATLDALERAAPALATCRSAHGEGTVRLVARYDVDGGAWQIDLWVLEGAPSLGECARAALVAAPAPTRRVPDETEAIEVRLTSP